MSRGAADSERVNRIAALANVQAYDEAGSAGYADGAPHIKHPVVRRLYAETALRVFESVAASSPVPRVLDLGAGDGATTMAFLELGATVVAIDSSEHQIRRLVESSAAMGDRLHAICGDVESVLGDVEGDFDIVTAISFLHHVPDYLTMIRRVMGRVKPGGVFFSFQDPIRYDTLRRTHSLFGAAGYLTWRVTRGDVIGGLARRFRRRRGIYEEDSVYDNTEYHVVRNGVDQDAIVALLEGGGFDCEVVRYFSNQSGVFQRLGSRLGVESSFAVIARRRG